MPIANTCCMYSSDYFLKDTKEHPLGCWREKRQFVVFTALHGCANFFFFFQQRVLMILWEEIRRGLRSSKSIPLPIDHIYGAERVFQLKGKQDLPRGSHFVDKAAKK